MDNEGNGFPIATKGFVIWFINPFKSYSERSKGVEERGIRMINTNIYNSINVLDKAADAAYIRNDVLANNIANDSTPNYKRQDVQFESILQATMAGGGSIEQKLAAVNEDLDELNSFVYTDHTSLSYRLDGNNVDIDQEEAYLAENQIRYQALVDQMSQEFGRYGTVLKS